jgi:hypothetical protein
LIAGNLSMPNPRGVGNIVGNPGNGFVRITCMWSGAWGSLIGLGPTLRKFDRDDNIWKTIN